MDMKISIRYLYFLPWILCWQRTVPVECHLVYSRRIYKQAIQLAEAVQKVQNSSGLDPNGDWEPKYEILEQLYSLETDHWPVLQELYKKVGEQSPLGRQIRIIFENIGTIQTYYKAFLGHFRDPEIFSPEQRRKFVNEATLPFTEFKNASDHIFFGFAFSTKVSIGRIAKSANREHDFCGGAQTPQQLLYQFYEAVALSDAKAAIVTLYAYDIQERLENSTLKILKNAERASLWRRLDKMYETVRDEISRASREISSCPVPDLENALELQVFQKYLVYQSDMANMWRATFDTCSDFKRERAGCDSISCSELPEQKRCRGELRNCETIPHRMDVCFSSPISNRRYDWIKTKQGQVYGSVISKCEKTRTFDYGLFSKFCFCDCEDDRMNLDRHFSLTDATSDIEDKKVVTGARLVKRDHVIYIQIQQGVLDRNGKISGDPAWKEIDKVSIFSSNSPKLEDLVFTVTHEQNTLRLDELNAGRNEVVTGLRFARINNDLALQIRKTPFDVFTGKLEMGSSWYHPNSEPRKGESSHKSRKAGSLQTEPIRPSIGTHVRFRTSDMVEDLGQHTIPFLDPQPVVSEFPMALSGAGFWLRNNNQTAGILTLKLIIYDLTTLI